MAQNPDRVTGWWVFAGVVLGVASILNIIYGIAAIDKASFFVNDQKYIFGSLKQLGNG